ncbi:MAG: archease [Dehalococcoidales bacterium]|nr:archease [Dehalococcoidales bacterium]
MPGKPASNDFKIIDHTADVGIMAYGTDLKQAFANAARGMFSLMTDLKRVRASSSREINISAADKESLLVYWLNELIYLFDTENFLGKKFEIKNLDDKNLMATVSGEKMDRTRHRIIRGIKATTYHMLEIKHNGGYQVSVIFDI